MIEAGVVSGPAARETIERLFGNERVEFVDVHNAKPGCFGARVVRHG